MAPTMTPAWPPDELDLDDEEESVVEGDAPEADDDAESLVEVVETDLVNVEVTARVPVNVSRWPF